MGALYEQDERTRWGLRVQVRVVGVAGDGSPQLRRSDCLPIDVAARWAAELQDAMTASWGAASEEAARRYAAHMGVPDFVYGPVTVPKGRSSREVSDGLLISLGRGVILQTKARSPHASRDAGRQTAWARKQIGKATDQVRGTRRTLASAPELQLTSRRGHSLTLSTDNERRWPGVVLLDIQDCPSGIDATSDDPETIVMTLDDWYALNHRVRSTSGVIDYVHRAIDAPTLKVELTKEADRYTNLAEADNELARRQGGYPILPLAGLSPQEEQAVASLDDWVDSDIAVAAGHNGGFDPDATRRAIEVIDAIPVAMRVEVAQALFRGVHKAELVGHAVSGVCQVHPSHHRLLYFFDQAGNWSSSEDFSVGAFAYAVARHEELDDRYGPGASLLLARMSFEDGHAFRTFVLIEGDAAELQLPSDVRSSILERHGMLPSSGIRPMGGGCRSARNPMVITSDRSHAAGIPPGISSLPRIPLAVDDSNVLQHPRSKPKEHRLGKPSAGPLLSANSTRGARRPARERWRSTEHARIAALSRGRVIAI